MIYFWQLFADGQTLYAVHMDAALSIPIAYFIAVIGSVLIREFTKGWLKYILALIYLGSFAATWYVLFLETSPLNYILVSVVLFGGVSGLSDWVRNIIRDIQKLV
jgi:hypothetical protein